MIINKYLSLILSGCFFLLLMLLASSIFNFVLHGIDVSYIFVILIIVFFMISRSFYNYLRNDEIYKNTKKRSSDVEGERYITKGEFDIKKVFIIVWVIVMLILLWSALLLIQ